MSIRKYLTKLGLVAVGMAVMCSFTLTGCIESTSDISVSGETGDDNTITVYTALEDDVIENYLVSFKNKHPEINVEIVRDSTGTIISKLIAEKEAPIADVVWGTAVSSMLSLEEYELREPYDPEGVDRILDKFKDKESPAKWVGMDVPETAMVVNKMECERLNIPVPKSYVDLIKPEYEGKIAMSDPTSSGTGLFIINGILQIMGEDKGWEYLDTFDKNVMEYTTSGSKPAKMAVSGDAIIGLAMGYRCVSLANENEECVVVFPEEGSGWDVEANCLIKKGNIKDASRVFLDWAITDEAMAAYQKEYPIICTGGDGTIPDGYDKEPVENLYQDMDLYKMAEDRNEFFEEFTNRYLSAR